MIKNKYGGIEYVFTKDNYTRMQAIYFMSCILKEQGIKHKRNKESIYISMNQDKLE